MWIFTQCSHQILPPPPPTLDFAHFIAVDNHRINQTNWWINWYHTFCDFHCLIYSVLFFQRHNICVYIWLRAGHHAMFMSGREGTQFFPTTTFKLNITQPHNLLVNRFFRLNKGGCSIFYLFLLLPAVCTLLCCTIYFPRCS